MKLINITGKHYLIFLILILGFGLRIYQINNNPPSLNWDEVSHGYNAYSILKTGKDEWGKRFPLIFRAYGDFKLPLYIYLSILPIKIFGLTALGVRFISVLSGTFLILVIYLISKKLFKNKIISLISGLLVAILPWTLFLSRVAVEANLALLLFNTAILFLLSKKYYLSTMFLGLSMYAYNSARILAPLIFLYLFIKLIKKRRFVQLVCTSIIFLFFLVPVVFQFFDQTAGARYFWVSHIDQGVVNQINEKRGSSTLPHILKKAFYNRPVYFVTASIKNYILHFSPQFLFSGGGDHYQFSMPGYGLLFKVTAPFLLLGLIYCFKNKFYLLLGWFLIGFAPSAITKGYPHVLRSILVLPVLVLFITQGLSLLVSWLKKKKSRFGGKLVGFIFVFSVLVSAGVWWRDYWRIYRNHYSWSWQYGYKQAVSYVKENYSDYDKIIFTKKYGEPHEFVLFYWRWKPSYYQQDPDKKWDYHAHWYWVDGFDKFEFWNDWEVISKLKTKNKEGKRILLVTSPGNYVAGGEKVKTINFLDNKPAFEIVKYE